MTSVGGQSGPHWSRGRHHSKLADRPQYSLAMPEGNAKILEVAVVQIRQHAKVNGLVDEEGTVLLQPDTGEPPLDLSHIPLALSTDEALNALILLDKGRADTDGVRAISWIYIAWGSDAPACPCRPQGWVYLSNVVTRGRRSSCRLE